MKNRILFFALTMALSCVTYQPIQGLSAAELWNSQSSNSGSSQKSGKKSYYNSTRKGNSTSNKSRSLYNGSGNTGTIGRVTQGGSRLSSTITDYKNLQVRKQSASKMWGLLSPAALKNRQSDIDNALQTEYNTRKSALASRVRAYKSNQKEFARLEQESEKFRQNRKEQERAYEQARHEKKMRALGKSSRSNKSYASNVRVKASEKKSYKPKRLFNIPD